MIDKLLIPIAHIVLWFKNRNRPKEIYVDRDKYMCYASPVDALQLYKRGSITFPRSVELVPQRISLLKFANWHLITDAGGNIFLLPHSKVKVLGYDRLGLQEVDPILFDQVERALKKGESLYE